ncbi:hypothetical protein R3P38DRAFT_2683147 [Favolaschia claudopus]|uniref:BTB domain-containing protein n=1 Tax=Favolaschia claudopus TaxID=2862362 RepID=A0AAW0DRZ0_9AGAR
MSTPAASIRDADDPFSPLSNADNPPDIILRSSDLVDFHVHKSVLSFASTFFRDMFLLPEGPNVVKDGKPVAPLPEPSQVANILLALCYPRSICVNSFLDLDGVDDAYEAADKYQILGGQAVLERLLDEPRFLEKEPHRVFAIACHRGLEKQAKAAAMATLKLPAFIPNIRVPEFNSISALKVRQLEEFRYQCSQFMVTFLAKSSSNVEAEDFTDPARCETYDEVWWNNVGHGKGCGPTFSEHGTMYPAEWLSAHMADVTLVAQVRPDIESVSAALRTIKQPILDSMSPCSLCLTSASASLSNLAYDLKYQTLAAQKELLAKYLFAS